MTVRSDNVKHDSLVNMKYDSLVNMKHDNSVNMKHDSTVDMKHDSLVNKKHGSTYNFWYLLRHAWSVWYGYACLIFVDLKKSTQSVMNKNEMQ